MFVISYNFPNKKYKMGSNDGLNIVAQNYEILKMLGQNWVSTINIAECLQLNLI